MRPTAAVRSAAGKSLGGPAWLAPKRVEEICGRLTHGQPVRRGLPERGRLHIDRPLPFLCVYRRPESEDDQGTKQLVMAEAAYLVVSEGVPARTVGRMLLRPVIAALVKEFGAFLLIEVRTTAGLPEPSAVREGGVHPPVFRVYAPRATELKDTVEKLSEQLEKVKIHKAAAEVEVRREPEGARRGVSAFLPAPEARRLRCYALGLEVAPIYRSADGETLYPLILRSLRRQFSRALQRTFHHFARTHTTHTPPSYQALGRRRVVKAVWEVDRKLAEIDESFDYLLQLTPVNVEQAWSRFRRRRFKEAPTFQYRPLPMDPTLLKRKLFAVPIERVEDPTLEQLFREKQVEIDRKLTTLMDRNTRHLLWGSLQLYGNPDGKLVQAATKILNALPKRLREDPRGGYLDARAFAERARQEIRHYRKQDADFKATVQVREDLYMGLMTSRGQLLVGRNTRIPRRRVEALLQHEVGTHVLTYYNGRAQPFRQLYVGLSGYDELQEGLAVLAEYLVGELSPARLRLLAARVLAAHHLIEGDSFLKVFRLLEREYRFDQKSAFTVTMRVFRGGGLTKDAVYLRGLFRILEYIREGGDLEPLYVGKIAARHVPLIRELQWRQVLRPAPLLPRFLGREDSRNRLEQLRHGLDPVDLVLSRKK